jgi:hypothetical protein
MTTPDTEALRRVAEAAVKSYRDDAPDKAAAIDFDVTFDPPTVLALLDERDTAANRISELEARVGVLEGALTKIADGKVPPDMHGHYLAHREAVKIARAALTPQEKDQGR